MFPNLRSFWTNLVQKIKIISLSSEIWFLDQFKYAEFSSDAHFFCFRPETQLLGKFAPKIQNCQFRLKLGTYANSNM